MSTNVFTQLAAGQITPVDTITIELLRTDDGMPASIIIRWQPKTVVRPGEFPPGPLPTFRSTVRRCQATVSPDRI
jgi:hypothetical protein